MQSVRLSTWLAAVALLALGACSTNDGRDLADPDPALTRVTTTAPTATGEAARGGAAAALAIPVSSIGPEGLVISSPDFIPGAALPASTTCDGSDDAPTITWSGNLGDHRLALVVRDADASGAVHWLVTGLTGRTGTVIESAGLVLENGFGEQGWTGPCPGDDLEHRYVFALYALNDDPEVGTGTSAGDGAQQIVEGIERDQVGAATTLGTYARS